jgi:hypothetical protein
VAADFFDNFLPDDGRVRRGVSARLKVGSTDVYELLRANLHCPLPVKFSPASRHGPSTVFPS